MKRSLTPDERRMVLGFDEEVVKFAVESFSNQEIAGMLDEGDTVEFLEQLARGPGSLHANRQKLLRFLGPKARKVVGALELDSELERFGGWLLGLLRDEPPSAGIRALNFGLFEGDHGCKLYVTGANRYDEHDSDWACANDWWPERRYAPVEVFSDLYGRLRKIETESWVVAQAVAILLIKAFFEKHGLEVKKVLGKRKLFIASGFDDGDLYAIKTAFTRAA